MVQLNIGHRSHPPIGRGGKLPGSLIRPATRVPPTRAHVYPLGGGVMIKHHT